MHFTITAAHALLVLILFLFHKTCIMDQASPALPPSFKAVSTETMIEAVRNGWGGLDQEQKRLALETYGDLFKVPCLHRYCEPQAYRIWINHPSPPLSWSQRRSVSFSSHEICVVVKRNAGEKAKKISWDEKSVVMQSANVELARLGTYPAPFSG